MLHLQPSNLIDIGGGGICSTKIWSTLALAGLSIRLISCLGWVSLFNRMKSAVSFHFLEADFHCMFSPKLENDDMDSLNQI